MVSSARDKAAWGRSTSGDQNIAASEEESRMPKTLPSESIQDVGALRKTSGKTSHARPAAQSRDLGDQGEGHSQHRAGARAGLALKTVSLYLAPPRQAV